MAEYTIVIGNKNYSSWSMRPWLVLRHLGVDLEEVIIPLRRPDTRTAILQHSPTGLVPVLKHGPFAVWDSLAICEYLAERYPEAGLWPEEPGARATARSVVAEMHGGFPILRSTMPLDCRSSRPGAGRAAGIEDEIARIVEIWEICRHCFGDGGDLLFGEHFSIADAFYAPVVSRFRTYGVATCGAAAEYIQAVWSLPTVQAWVEAAESEPWTIDW